MSQAELLHQSQRFEPVQNSSHILCFLVLCHDEQYLRREDIPEYQKSDTLCELLFLSHLGDPDKHHASCILRRITRLKCINSSMYKFDKALECLGGLILSKYEFRLKVFYFYIDLWMNLPFSVMFYLHKSPCPICILISILVHTYPYLSFLWIRNRPNTFSELL